MKKGRIPMNLELFEKARALGEAMAQTDEYKAVQAAQTQLDADEEAQALIGQYNGLQTTMQELMQAENPDRDAVAALGGSIEVAAREGGGTRFTVYFPEPEKGGGEA